MHSNVFRTITVLAIFQCLLGTAFLLAAIFVYQYDIRYSAVSTWTFVTCLTSGGACLAAILKLRTLNLFPTAIFFNIVSIFSNATYLAWLTITVYEAFHRSKTTVRFGRHDDGMIDRYSENMFLFGMSSAYTCVAAEIISAALALLLYGLMPNKQQHVALKCDPEM